MRSASLPALVFGININAHTHAHAHAPPSNKMLPAPRPTSVPSGILIHPAVWTQRTWAENPGLYPYAPPPLGDWVPSNTMWAWAEAYQHTKWHPNPPDHLATIRQRLRHRHTGQPDNGLIA